MDGQIRVFFFFERFVQTNTSVLAKIEVSLDLEGSEVTSQRHRRRKGGMIKKNKNYAG